MCLLWSYYSSTCFGTGMWNLSHIERAKPQTWIVSIKHSDLPATLVRVVLSCSILKPKLCGMGAHGFYICLLVRSAGHIFSNRPALWPVAASPTPSTLQKHNRENQFVLRSMFSVLSPSLFLLPSLSFPSFHLIKAHGLSLLFTKYSLTKKKWEFYWLKIKVAKSPPQIPPFLLEPLKNRGKHQFLTHQWRLHNQLKKTLVWGCKSYLCLIKAFRRYMPGFNVIK